MRFLLLSALALGSGYLLGRARTRDDLAAAFIIVTLVGVLVLTGAR